MEDNFIKIYSKVEQEKMDKNFLIDRNLLLEEQLKIRLTEIEKLHEVINLNIEMLKLQQDLFLSLWNKFRFEINDDLELIDRLISNLTKLEAIRKKIINQHGTTDSCTIIDSAISIIEYLKSEWINIEE